MRAIRVTGSGPIVFVVAPVGIQNLPVEPWRSVISTEPAGWAIGRRHRRRSVGATRRPTNSLSAFYLDNGARTLPGWPVVLNGPIFGSPVIGGQFKTAITRTM